MACIENANFYGQKAIVTMHEFLVLTGLGCLQLSATVGGCRWVHVAKMGVRRCLPYTN